MGTLILVIIIFALALGLFALGRKLVNWYFKIDERVNLLKKIEENTRKNIQNG